MALPKARRVLFRKAPLKLVIAQVQFPVLPRWGERGYIGAFSDAIQAEYPRRARLDQMSIQVTPQGIRPDPRQELWRFTSRDHLWAVVVGETAITLEVRGYSAIDEFLNRFKRVLVAGSETLDFGECTRIGLRYVNEVRVPGADTLGDWRRLLRPEFVGFAGGDLLDGSVEHMLQEVRVKRPDGTFAVRHGFLSGTVVEPLPGESPVTGRFYLIDMDYYDTAERTLDVEAIAGQMKQYNAVMYDFFCWTLGEALYEALEPVDVD